MNKLLKHTSIPMVALYIFQNHRFHLKAAAEKYLICNTEVLRVEMDVFKRGSQSPNDNAVHEEHEHIHPPHRLILQVTVNNISLAERFW